MPRPAHYSLWPRRGVCKTDRSMNLLPLVFHRVPRALRALVLIATLVLGSAAHLLHHIEDSHCGESRGAAHGAEHFCGACSNLHGGALASGDAPAPAPARVVWTGFAIPATSEYFAAPTTAGVPRAPPAA